jgi:hypothetical protein
VRGAAQLHPIGTPTAQLARQVSLPRGAQKLPILRPAMRRTLQTRALLLPQSRSRSHVVQGGGEGGGLAPQRFCPPLHMPLAHAVTLLCVHSTHAPLPLFDSPPPSSDSPF